MQPSSKKIIHIVSACALVFCLVLPLQAQNTAKNAACKSTNTQEVVNAVIESTVLLISQKVHYENPLVPNSGLVTAFEDVPHNGSTISSGVFGARQQTALGSGVLFKKDQSNPDTDARYYVITNAHVIKDFTSIWVVLSDDTFFKAELEGMDETIDIAIMSFTTKKALPLIAIRDSDALSMGESVYALGNPLGVSFTVTKGIVSHVNRYTEYRSDTVFSGPYLQTDAAINQGNSGGVLVDSCGAAIGIITFIISGNDRNNIGLNFALPINVAMQSVTNILKKRQHEFGWIGIVVNDYSLDIRKQLGLNTRAGIFIQNVFLPSPAYKAGLRPGDLLEKIDDRSIITRDSYSSIFSTISKKRVGATIRLTVQSLQNKNSNAKYAALDMLIPIEKRPERLTSKEYRMKLWPGMMVKPLQAYEKELYGIPDERSGIFVLKVFKDTAADISGLRSYDLIVKINNAIVRSWQDYTAAFTNTNAKSISVMRMGEQLELSFKAAADESF